MELNSKVGGVVTPLVREDTTVFIDGRPYSKESARQIYNALHSIFSQPRVNPVYSPGQLMVGAGAIGQAYNQN